MEENAGNNPNPFIIPSLTQFDGIFIDDLPFPNIFYKDNQPKDENIKLTYNLVDDLESKTICENISKKGHPQNSQKIVDMICSLKEDRINNFDIFLNTRGARLDQKDLNNESENSQFLNSFLKVLNENKEKIDIFQRISPLEEDNISNVMTQPSITPLRDQNENSSNIVKISKPQQIQPKITQERKVVEDEGVKSEDRSQYKIKLKPTRRLSEFIVVKKPQIEVKRLEDAIGNLFIWNSQNINNLSIPKTLTIYLLTEIIQAKNQDVLSKITDENISKIIKILSDEISKNVEIFSRPLDESKNEKLYELIEKEYLKILSCLKCCEIILEIMTLQNISKKLLVEETLEVVIEFFKKIFREYFFPYTEFKEDKKNAGKISQRFGGDPIQGGQKKPKRKPRRRSKKNNGLGNFIDDGDDDDVDELYQPRLRSDYRNDKKEFYKDVSISLTNLLKKFYDLLEKNVTKDEFMFDIIEISLSSFFTSIEGNGNDSNELYSIQIQSMNIMTLIFSNHISKRESILTNIAGNILNLPKKKRSKKTYYLNDDRVYIHTFTALILKLIQSCAGTASDFYSDEDEETPTPHSPGNFLANFDLNELIPKGSMSVEILDANYERAYSCAKIFADFLLNRCKQESVDGDNRLIIDRLVDDLLVCLSLPSWPAADLVLRVLTQQVIEKYIVDVKVDDKMRSKGVDVLGKICSKCILILKETTENDYRTVKTESIFQALKETGSTEDFYSRFEGKRTQLSENDLFQLLVHNFLASKQEMSKTHNYDLQFTLCQWYFRDENKDEKSWFYRELWQRSPKNFRIVGKYINDIIPSHLRILQSYKETSIVNYITTVRNQILAVTKDPRTKIRHQAVKSVIMLISVDPNLMNQKYVQNVIIERSKDQSIKVRESVVDLVGKYIQSCTNQISEYINMIINCLKDTGKSVRKRSIKILSQIFQLDLLEEKQRTSICLALSSLLHDHEEENIQKLVINTFTDFWFNIKSIIRSNNNNNNLNNNSYGNAEQLRHRILQIVDVISHKPLARSTIVVDIKEYWLTVLLNKVKTKNKDSCRKICEGMSEQLIDYIISLASEYSGENVTATMPLNGKRSINTCMQTLYIFTHTFPELLCNLVKALAVYVDTSSILFTQNQLDSMYYLCKILISVIPNMPAQNEQFNNPLLKGLVRIIGNAKFGNWDIFESCVECFCIFCKKLGNYSTMGIVLDKLYHIVKSKPVSRAIRTLGYLCLHHDFKSVELTLTSGLICSKAITQIYKVFIGIYQKSADNVRIKCDVIESLGSMMSKFPRMFLEKSFMNILENGLEKESDVQLKLTVISTFSKYLLKEEAKLIEKGEMSKTETSIGMSIIPKYIKKILGFLSLKEVQLRLQTLELIRITVRQGLYVPSVLAPYTIAFVGDIEPTISNLSHSINLTMFEKFRSEFVIKTAEGIKLCYKLLVKNGVFNERFGLTKVYSIISKFSRREKNSFFDNLIRSINDIEDVQFIKFLYDFFLSVKFVLKEEVCHIVYKIDFWIDKDSSDIRDQLKVLKHKQDKEKKDDEDIRQKCLIAGRLIILIHLKVILMNSYNISNSDMESYNDSNPSQVYKKQLKKYNTDFLNLTKIKDIVPLIAGNKYVEVYNTFKEMYELHVNHSCKFTQSRLKKGRRGRKPSTTRKRKRKTDKTQNKKKRKVNENKEGEDKDYVPPPKKTRGRRKKKKIDNDDDDDDYVPPSTKRKRKKVIDEYPSSDEDDEEKEPPLKSMKK